MNVKYPIEKNYDLLKKVVYVVNPEGNLPGTEEVMSKYFSSNFFWERIFPQKFNEETILKKIKKGFIYMLIQ